MVSGRAIGEVAYATNKNHLMNKWKTAFWICLLLFVISTVSGFVYLTISDMKTGLIKDGSQAYKEDLNKLIIIFNKDLKTKQQIETEFKVNGYSPFVDQKGDTASLMRSDFVFKNDTLIKILARDN
jgi:hypothetical protein